MHHFDSKSQLVILIMFVHMQEIANGIFHHQHFSTNDVIFDEMYGNNNQNQYDFGQV